MSVSGNMQITQWTDGHGNTQIGYQVIADSVVSARTVRPGGRKGAAGQPTDALRRAHEQNAQSNSHPVSDFSNDAPF